MAAARGPGRVPAGRRACGAASPCVCGGASPRVYSAGTARTGFGRGIAGSCRHIAGRKRTRKTCRAAAGADRGAASNNAQKTRGDRAPRAPVAPDRRLYRGNPGGCRDGRRCAAADLLGTRTDLRSRCAPALGRCRRRLGCGLWRRRGGRMAVALGHRAGAAEISGAAARHRFGQGIVRAAGAGL